MHDQRGVAPHGRQVLQAPACLQVDQTGHFAIVDGGNLEPAGDADPIDEGLMVAGLAENVGGRRAGDFMRIKAQLGKGLLIALDDGDHPLGGGEAHPAVAENVPCQRGRLLEEIQGAQDAFGSTLRNHHRYRTCADMQRRDDGLRCGFCLFVAGARHPRHSACGPPAFNPQSEGLHNQPVGACHPARIPG